MKISLVKYLVLIIPFGFNSVCAKSNIPKTKNDSATTLKTNIGLMIGSSAINFQNKSNIHEVGFFINTVRSTKWNYYLEFGTANYIVENINLNETILEKDENGILTGEYRTIVDTINQLNGFALGLGAMTPSYKGFHLRGGISFNFNRSYGTSFSSDYTYRRINNFTDPTPSGELISDGTQYDIKYSNYANGQIFNSFHSSMQLGLHYKYKRFDMALIGKVGIMDITKNSFFNNEIFNSTQYLGLRISLDLFKIHI
jgi:hypothetical protein